MSAGAETTTQERQPIKSGAPSERSGNGSARQGTSRASLQLRRLAAEGFEAQEAALAPVQRQGPGRDVGDVHAAAARGTEGSGGGLPHGEKIQAAFGHHDVSGVQSFVGGKAQEAAQSMGAAAYATGNKAAFAQAPSLHTAAHEAAHIVQQRSGVSLSGGVGEVGDRYERQADAVADRVVQGRSAVDLLDGGKGAQAVQRKASGAAVQRDTETPAPTPTPPTVAEVSNAIRDPPYGWTSSYQATVTGAEIQLLIRVRLIPDEAVTAEQLADVQRRTHEGVATYLDNQFVFTDTVSHTDYAVRVSVEFVDSGEHLAINLRPGNSRSNLSHWSVERPTATFAHELGHQLGLKDEYVDPGAASRATATSAGVHQDHSLMGNFAAEGKDEAALRARHGATIAGHIGSATGRSFTVTRR